MNSDGLGPTGKEMHQKLSQLANDAYRAGFIDGLAAYSYWQGGKQYVGTSGLTLEQAVAEVESTWNFNPPFKPEVDK